MGGFFAPRVTVTEGCACAPALLEPLADRCEWCAAAASSLGDERGLCIRARRRRVRCCEAHGCPSSELCQGVCYTVLYWSCKCGVRAIFGRNEGAQNNRPCSLGERNLAATLNNPRIVACLFLAAAPFPN